MAEGHSRARASVISTSVILHMRIGAAFLSLMASSRAI
jgi:hypothetical protein